LTGRLCLSCASCRQNASPLGSTDWSTAQPPCWGCGRERSLLKPCNNLLLVLPIFDILVNALIEPAAHARTGKRRVVIQCRQRADKLPAAAHLPVGGSKRSQANSIRRGISSRLLPALCTKIARVPAPATPGPAVHRPGTTGVSHAVVTAAVPVPAPLTAALSRGRRCPPLPV
jgi:hypothetical protein